MLIILVFSTTQTLWDTQIKNWYETQNEGKLLVKEETNFRIIYFISD